MRNLDRFNEAFGHMEHSVMGRRLAKFTLRHRFWLEALGSPLVTGGEAGLMDLELATRVCAIPFAKLDARLPRLLARGPGWGGRLVYLASAWRRDAAVEYRLFQAYLMDHGCPPATYEDEVHVVGGDDGEVASSSPLPGILGLITGLIRGAGWEPDIVWGLSPGEAEWYLAGVFLHRGVDVGLKTAADEAMEEFLRSRSKKAAAGFPAAAPDSSLRHEEVAAITPAPADDAEGSFPLGDPP